MLVSREISCTEYVNIIAKKTTQNVGYMYGVRNYLLVQQLLTLSNHKWNVVPMTRVPHLNTVSSYKLNSKKSWWWWYRWFDLDSLEHRIEDLPLSYRYCSKQCSTEIAWLIPLETEFKHNTGLLQNFAFLDCENWNIRSILHQNLSSTGHRLNGTNYQLFCFHIINNSSRAQHIKDHKEWFFIESIIFTNVIGQIS